MNLLFLIPALIIKAFRHHLLITSALVSEILYRCSHAYTVLFIAIPSVAQTIDCASLKQAARPNHVNKPIVDKLFERFGDCRGGHLIFHLPICKRYIILVIAFVFFSDLDI